MEIATLRARRRLNPNQRIGNPLLPAHSMPSAANSSGIGLTSPTACGIAVSRARVRLTAQLNHPHILPLLDSGEGAGLLYCIMPLVEGESLRERLRRERRLSVDDAGAEARPESADARRSKRRGAAPCEFDSRLGHRGRPAIDT
jgi:hypothetical protein